MRPHAWIVAFLMVGLPGQEPCWRLPARGAAEFNRSGAAWTGAAATKAQALALQPTAAAPDRLLPRLPPAPWLCQGELREDQRAVGDPPRDLRDVVRAVATDLAARGSADWRFARLLPFGDLRLQGTVREPDAAGSQSYTLAVQADPPQSLPGEDRSAAERLVRPLCPAAATACGVLTVTRRIDADAGLVREFAGVLRLCWRESKEAWRVLVVEERWSLVAVRDNQDADFRRRVAAAVAAGAAWLRGELDGVDETFLQDKGPEPRSFGSGRLALGLLTLLHAHLPPEDRVVAAGFAALRKRKLVDTYSLAVALMALAQRYGPADETVRLRSGTLQQRVPRELDATDRAVAQRWLDTLLANVDRRVPVEQQLRFNYVPGSRWDVSLQQYGLLGLDAAALCQLPVPGSAWQAAATALMGVQAQGHGRNVRLSLVSHREAAAAGEATAPVRVPTRGFAYQEPTAPAYGSMTSAGINGLVLARSALAAGKAPRELLRQIDDAIDAGFGWLAAEFTVRANPGFAGRSDDHWYYWLYGLERTCELAGIAHLQGRDWYYEGALQLLAQQQANGSFKAERAGSLLLDATCFAVLFLQKTTPPAMTRTSAR